MKRKVSKTRQELLENTINHFNSENRGINTSDPAVCVYYCDTSNKKCAIGIEVNKKTAMALQDENLPIQYNGSFYLLPKRLQNMGKSFLGAIQRLHDESKNWTETGLSLTGKAIAEDIKNQYNLK